MDGDDEWMPDNDDAADDDVSAWCWLALADDDCASELENEEDDELLLLELELDEIDDADDAEPPLAVCDDGMAVFEPPDDPTEFANWQ